ncbi:MAG: sigma-70 family RNA polymerase sigma factor [Gemmataceae bacterium]
MTRHSLLPLLHHLGRAAAPTGLDDAELLRRYTTARDPAAFALLVWRHGALVYGVCRRMLGQAADADDAFQATFLMLAQQAGTLRRGEALGGWLHRVARRVCLRSRRQALRRRGREQRAARSEALPPANGDCDELRLLLDREIERLPVPYRAAFILCDLEGRSGVEAARVLGCPPGTLHSRLARARARLRARLSRRGVSPLLTPAGPVPAALLRSAAEIVRGRIPGAAAAGSIFALTEGVLKPMILTKIKYVLAATVAVLALGSGAVFLGRPTAGAAPRPADETIEELRRENARLRRELAVVTAERDRLRAAMPQRTVVATDDAPSDAEILRALPAVPANLPEGWQLFRDNVSIVKERITDRIEEARFYPLVGPARLRHTHWKCTVHFTEMLRGQMPYPFEVKKDRVEVVYIDRELLLIESRVTPKK